MKAPAFVLSCLLLTLSSAAPSGAASTSGEESDPKSQKQTTAEQADDLLIVDCALPARVRRLGARGSYLTPRKPIRTTAADCRIRGGEYTEPDQANYATSLAVWLPEAQAGDAEAQFYVGQIYEKGLGAQPDYQLAAKWYRKSADQGSSASLVSLAYLHEMGLGVERDGELALNLYRQAAGASEDLVLLAESDYDQLIVARGEVAQREEEVEALRQQLGELGGQLDELAEDSQTKSSRLETLEGLMAKLERELEDKEGQLEQRAQEVARLERMARIPVESVAGAGPGLIDPSALAFGSYHALVIGNSNYSSLPRLERASADARKVAATLEGRYGFTVDLLVDATRLDVMSALNRLRKELTEKDNLLIYYAGHGTRDAARNTAYWQPIDAASDNPVNWIPNGVLADHLDLIPAKHVMVVADSAFTGLRTRSSVARLEIGSSRELRTQQIQELLGRRTRLVLASGKAMASDGSSSFTDAFLAALESGEGVIEASQVYRSMNQQLAKEKATPPAFASLRFSRNEVSDFFFVAVPPR